LQESGFPKRVEKNSENIEFQKIHPNMNLLKKLKTIENKKITLTLTT